MLEALASADASRIEEALPTLQGLAPARRATVFLDEAARAGLIRYFEIRINDAVDGPRARFDYGRADTLLKELGSFLSDSQAVKDIADRLADRKSAARSMEEALAAAEAAEAQAAAALRAAAAPAVSPPATGAAVVSDPAPSVVTALDRQSNQELRAQVAGASRLTSITLQDARRLAAAIEELGRRGDSEAPALKKQLKLQLAIQVATIKARSGVDQATRFAEGAYALFPDSPALKKALLQVRLTAAQRAAEKRDGTLLEIKKNLETLLAGQRVDDTWAPAFESELRRLAALLLDTDPYMVQVKRTAGGIYLGRATVLREVQRTVESERMLDRARTLGADPGAVLVEERALADVRARQAAENQVRDKAAQLTARKDKLLAQAQANEVVAALEMLRALRTELPKKDPFLTEQAPNAIARAYLRMASAAARDGRYKDAVSLAGRGRDVSKSLPEVSQARQRYVRYEAIDDLIRRRSDFDTRAIRRDLAAFAKQDAEETTIVTRQLVRTILTRANTTDSPEAAGKLTRAARELTAEEFLVNGQAKE